MKELPEILNEEEERNLLIDFSKGDKCARDKLIEHNIRLVYNIVYKHFKNPKSFFEDYISIGFLGLIKGVDTFDINKGFKLNTYLYICIKNEILQYLRKYKNEILPDSFDKRDYLFNLEEGFTSLNLIKDNSLTPEEVLLKEEKFKFINKSILNLKKYDKDLIDLYFYKNLSQLEIGEIYNLSQAQVSRDLNKILKKMRKEII